MAKGGARIASDLFAVGKGMGLEQHYELLLLINDKNTLTTREAIKFINEKYARWDDPDSSGPTETCRSYLKELWRLGLIEKFSLQEKIVPRDSMTWTGNDRGSRYCINSRGKFVLNKSADLFAYYVAWCIKSAIDSNIYPQARKLIELFNKIGYIPINDDECVKLSKAHGLYIEKHAGKAIKFGWLEPTGIIYRKRNNYFVNKEYLEVLGTTNIKDLFNEIVEIVVDSSIEIKLNRSSFGLTDYHSGSEYKIVLSVCNKSAVSIAIRIKPIFFCLFSKISNATGPEQINVGPEEVQDVMFTVTSYAARLSDSLMQSKLGYFEIDVDRKKYKIFMPSIEIKNDDHIWELELCKLFNELEVQAFHLSGKSDRPDAVIDLSRLETRPTDLLDYLRDCSKEKLLMETTLNEYDGSKLISDTIKKNTRGLNKYQTHTSYVLKIKAKGQIIVADYFSKNIDNAFKKVKNHCQHIVTLIDKETFKCLIEKYKKNKGGIDLNKILTSGKIVLHEDIDEI